LSKDSEKKTLLDPYGISIIPDYERLYAEFGIEPFEQFLPQIQDAPSWMRRGTVFGHRDFNRIMDAMRNKQEFSVMSGIKPTGEFHLGTLMTAKELVFFQQKGAKAFYCIADVEAYEDNRIPFEKSEKIAIENVADILALGLDPKNAYIYRQSEEEHVKHLAIVFARAVTLATIKAIYGERNMGLYLSALIQAGDILLPQLADFGGPKPTIIPVGIDQDPHIRFTRDLAQTFHSKYDFVFPSSTYHKLMRGLDGSTKMSKRLGNYFTLGDTDEEVRLKISTAFTGGRPTIKEQREKGGIPEVCPIYDICLCHFMEDDIEVQRVYNDCKTGKLLCGEHKQQVIDIVLKFVDNHKRKKSKMITKAKEILEIEQK
jgi:tryptophanyl-tRNA synthetase